MYYPKAEDSRDDNELSLYLRTRNHKHLLQYTIN